MTLTHSQASIRIDVGRRCPIIYTHNPVVTLIGARATDRLFARDVASAYSAIQQLEMLEVNSSAQVHLAAKWSTFSSEDIAMAMLAKGSWARPDSNREPTGYEPDALPLSYGPLRREVYGC